MSSAATERLSRVEYHVGGYNYYGTLAIAPDALVFSAARRRHVMVEVICNSAGVAALFERAQHHSWREAIVFGVIVGTIFAVLYQLVRRNDARKAPAESERFRFRVTRAEVKSLKKLWGGKILIERPAGKAGQLEPIGLEPEALLAALERFGWRVERPA